MQKISIRTVDPQAVGQSARRLASVASTIMQDSAANTANLIRNLGSVTDAVRGAASTTSSKGTVRTVPCCPPEEYCPPACLLTINRSAHPGEVVMVPFKIHNRSGETKRYRLGLRPMVDQGQNPAPTQPTLSRTAVEIPPTQSVLITLRADFTPPAYNAGDELQTTVVIREREYNQNVCVELSLTPYSNVPEAMPWDEQDLSTHFVGWHHHFYCDDTRRPTKAPGKIPRDVEPKG